MLFTFASFGEFLTVFLGTWFALLCFGDFTAGLYSMLFTFASLGDVAVWLFRLFLSLL